ncbi:hypothetical protein NBRC111894_3202 [Sporolactobacillus inulinus]|uniref:Uncharacterized protein n=1 Tax=Sporolactobacillus inulinus TaxID=2078 RepID=A0A4Y1ZGN8_9BACL|nr:hypothetical protein NBRC111894_3202 [Sporolactobacillus inulinus]
MLNRRFGYSLAAGAPRTTPTGQESAGSRWHASTMRAQASEHLRFDYWPRHWSIGLKRGQNLILLKRVSQSK